MREQIRKAQVMEIDARVTSARLEEDFLSKTGTALTAPQIFALSLLADQGMVNHTTMAAHLECSRGNVTGILDRLESLNLIVRTRSAEDRRIVDIAATDAGIALMQKALNNEHGTEACA